MIFKMRLGWFLGWLICACAVHAQVVLPNAGMIEQNIERDFKSFKPNSQPSTPALVQPLSKEAQSSELNVTVKKFQIHGNRLLSDKVLLELVQPYLNRSLSFAQLKGVSDIVMNEYRQAGWLVRVYLPEQDISDGVVKIEVLEGVFGGTQVEGDHKSQRVNLNRLIDMGNQAVAKGEAVRAVKIDRALLLMGDLPGVSVVGNMLAGDIAGESKLSLQVQDTALWQGSLSADNAGSASTGAARIMFNGYLNSPSGSSEQWTGNILKSEGSNYGRLAYSLPVGLDGFKAGLHGSSLNYKLIGNFATLSASGAAYTTGLDATYPLIRSLNNNLNLIGNWDHKWFNNQANQNVTSKYEIHLLNLTLSGNMVDTLASGGVSTYSLGLSNGQVNLADSPNVSADSSGPNTAGPFTKTSVNFSRQQNLTGQTNLFISISAQKANRNLDSSEKTYLGGMTGVRAYPSNEAGGSDGQFFSLEFRQRWWGQFSSSIFYDAGHITMYHNNQDNNGNPLSAINDVTLRGGGLSLGWQGLRGVDLKLSVARRLLSNPLANAQTGADSDGSHKLNRVWFTASLAY
jgi:hemolysin activation/secretion protein